MTALTSVGSIRLCAGCVDKSCVFRLRQEERVTLHTSASEVTTLCRYTNLFVIIISSHILFAAQLTLQRYEIHRRQRDTDDSTVVVPTTYTPMYATILEPLPVFSEAGRH